MLRTKALTLLTAASLAMPMAALADRGNGQGHGNGNVRHQQGNGNGHPVEAATVRGCPPGLANREPACVPPGQARQGVTTGEWTGYRVGDVVDEDRLEWLDLSDYDLPDLPEGQRYAVIDGTVVVLDEENYELLQLIRTAAAVFN